MVRKPHQPRFVRLSQAHCTALLGNAELEPWMVIAGGRFVARQRVAMIGPGGRIDGVAVVGPVVEATQISFSHQDEERLGLPAGAAQGRDVLLVGPAGEARVIL